MKKYLLVLVATASLYALPTSAFAAITLDSSTVGVNNTTLSNGTNWSHTVTGTNNILFVYVLTANQGDAVTGVSYDGVAMTLSNKQFRTTSSTQMGYLWYLVAPHTGTHSVSVSMSSTEANGTAISASYNGVAQTAPEASNALGDGNPGGTSTTISVTTVADNAWLVGAFADMGASSLAAGSNTTIRQTSPYAVFVDSNGPQTPAGSKSMSVSSASNGYWIDLIASIAPATGSGGGTTTPAIYGSGTTNRIPKFTASTTIGDSLFSDDGSNITLTAGNLLMQVNSYIDAVTNGNLYFGTLNATTLTFGRTGQNMVINSNVGIGTSTPSSALDVNGTITASSTSLGTIGTLSNCSSTATASACGSAPTGSVAMSTASSTQIVYTTAVTANSNVFITENSALGSRLGITCNTTTGRVYSVSAITPNKAFVIKSSANPATNKACLSYLIVN